LPVNTERDRRNTEKRKNLNESLPRERDRGGAGYCKVTKKKTGGPLKVRQAAQRPSGGDPGEKKEVGADQASGGLEGRAAEKDWGGEVPFIPNPDQPKRNGQS